MSPLLPCEPGEPGVPGAPAWQGVGKRLKEDKKSAGMMAKKENRHLAAPGNLSALWRLVRHWVQQDQEVRCSPWRRPSLGGRWILGRL